MLHREEIVELAKLYRRESARRRAAPKPAETKRRRETVRRGAGITLAGQAAISALRRAPRRAIRAGDGANGPGRARADRAERPLGEGMRKATMSGAGTLAGLALSVGAVTRRALPDRLEEAGITVIQNRCTLADHQRLGLGKPERR